MGDKRTAARVTGNVVLDAGALIALERGDRELVAALKSIRTLAYRVVIPATVLAQVWRGGSRSVLLARLVAVSEVGALNEVQAKAVGVRLGERGGRDVVDAHVVCCAVEHGAAIATSDPSDIRALADPDERLTVIAV